MLKCLFYSVFSSFGGFQRKNERKQKEAFFENMKFNFVECSFGGGGHCFCCS